MVLTVLPGAALADSGDGKNIQAGFPFLLGATRGSMNEVVPMKTYDMGTNPGTVLMDGSVHNYPIPETFAQFATKPASDHPDGTAYIWIYDDSENVYFINDWTSDNTFDAGDDFFTVHINDGTGLKSYTQHTEPVGGEYGQALFDYTQTVDYQHMYYVIAVPKAELKSENLKVGFEIYGTAALSANLLWNGTPPATVTAGTPTSFVIDYSTTFVNDQFYQSIQKAFLFEYTTDTELEEFLGDFYCDSDNNIYQDYGTYTPYTGPIKTIACTTFSLASDDREQDGTISINASFNKAGKHKLVVVFCYIYYIDSYSNEWHANYLTTEIDVLDSKSEPAIQPTASKKAGTYTGSASVKLTSATSEAKIYYTLDGTTPKTSSKSVNNGGTVTISKTSILKAIAVKSGYTNSSVFSAKYTIKTSKPTANNVPKSKKVKKGKKITLKAPAGTTLYYTTNGKSPTAKVKTKVSPGKTKKITIKKKTKLKVIAVKKDCEKSSVVKRTYKIK